MLSAEHPAFSLTPPAPRRPAHRAPRHAAAPDDDAAPARGFDAGAVAESWEGAWNAHDLEAVLAHFADDAVFTSSPAGPFPPDGDCVLMGKDAIRESCRATLASTPELRFAVETVYVGVDVVVLTYRDHLGTLACDVLRLRDGLVVDSARAQLAAQAPAPIPGAGERQLDQGPDQPGRRGAEPLRARVREGLAAGRT